MDLPVIGAHCELESCRSLDLLPISCNGCQRVFCRHHSPLSSHSCPSLESNQTSLDVLNEVAPTSKREHCAFSGCSKVTLESVIVDKVDAERRVVAICSNCAQAYCAVHRHPSDHACTHLPALSSSSEKNPEAHALLKKYFPAAASPQTSSHTPRAAASSSADPKKLARLRAVDLMKMRHRAVPADPRDKTASVSLSQRIHFKTILTGATSSTEKIFWARKTVITGKVLDLIAESYSVHISDSTPVYLETRSAADGSPVRLRNDKLLSEQIADGETIYLRIENPHEKP